MKAVCHNVGMGQILCNRLRVGFPQIHSNLRNGFALFLGPGSKMRLERLFLAIGQNANHSAPFQIIQGKGKLVMPFLEGKLIYPQFTHLMPQGNLRLLDCLFVIESLDTFVTKVLLAMNCRNTGASTLVKKELPVALCEATAFLQPRQFLSKRALAVWTPEASRRKRNQANSSRPGQIAHSAWSVLMRGATYRLTRGARGGVCRMFTKDKEPLGNGFVFQTGDYHTRQV